MQGESCEGERTFLVEAFFFAAALGFLATGFFASGESL
jgi:hypothetical protein